MGENRPELLANETLYQLSYDPVPTAGGEMADRRPDGKRGIPRGETDSHPSKQSFATKSRISKSRPNTQSSPTEVINTTTVSHASPALQPANASDQQNTLRDANLNHISPT